MRVLLDTCAFLWIAVDAPELSDRARDLFRSTENEVFLSAVSTWEIAIEHRSGRLSLPDRPDTYIPALRARLGVESLPVSEEATLYLGRLPELHRDPFDRMLVCQSIVEGMVLLTADQEIQQYPVRFMW